MKKIRRQIALVSAFIALAINVAVIPLETGCQTAGNATVKAEGAVVLTVDAAMKGWKDWVMAGHATQAQVDKVKALYNEYYAAQLLAKQTLVDFLQVSGDTTKSDADRAAAKTALTNASANAAAKSTSLVTTITGLTNK